MSMQIPPEAAQQIGACLFAGRKIEAIKLYRTQTGSDLSTAKSAIEALEAELRAREPGRFTAAPAATGKGCAVLLAVLGALITAVVLALLLFKRQ